MDSKADGGMGLDGKDMILGGGAALLATLGLARYGGKAVGALAKRFGGTAAGVAEGKALEAAAGVTPVYVVNMPEGGVAGAAGSLLGGVTGLGSLAGGAMLAKAGLAAAAVGAAGYGVYKVAEGTAIGDRIGATFDKVMAFFGSQQAEQAIALEQKLQSTDIGGTINIKIDSEGRAAVISTSSSNKNVRFNVDAGMTMAGAY